MTTVDIRMGLQIPSFTFPEVGAADLFETISATAVAAEHAGFDSVYVMDHFYQLPMIGSVDENMFEAYTLLSAIAARTQRVRLGCMVGGMTYRNPAFLAKQVTALDVISRGRAIWGIGAGWFEQEHTAYGYEFGTFTDRFEKLEEGLQIVKGMFVDETTTFEGKWFTVRDALNVPKPVTPGGPPVLIGGSGEKKTLRMVAQYGDACNVFGGPDQVRHLMGVLDQHCERLGRDPKEICRTRLGTVTIGDTTDDAWARVFARYGVSSVDELPPLTRMRVDGSIIGDADTVCERVQALLDAGLDGMIISLIDAHDTDSVAHAGEVLSAVLRR
ncbi:MAG: LLM class F420-dependent oxidoreductase [Ilumatobacteraceae bacterium]